MDPNEIRHASHISNHTAESEDDLKKGVHHNVHEVRPSDDSGYDPENAYWITGFRNRFPWVGFGGFMTMLAATSCAVAVLCRSDGKRVKEWPFENYTIQPNVLINVATAVSNLGLITLIGQGLAIAWWRKATRGSSINTLHRNHAYSYSFISIMTSGKHFNVLALAALMTKFTIVDSTLFQKSTKSVVTQQKNYANASVTAWMETTWPQNSGGVAGDSGAVKTLDAKWASVIDAFNGRIANNKMHDKTGELSSFTNCPFSQECRGYLQGYGFSFDCDTEESPVDYGAQRQTQQGGNFTSYPMYDLRFNFAGATNSTPYASIQMNMTYVDSHDGPNETCPGTKTRRTCRIRPAIVEYPVTVMTPSEKELAGGNIVTHIAFFDTKSYEFGTEMNFSQIDNLKVVEYVDLNERLGEASTVGAINFAMNNLFRSSANLTYDKDWDMVVEGSQAQSMFFAENSTETFSRCWYHIDPEGLDDPAVRILRKMNTLAFVAALYLEGDPDYKISERAGKGLSSQTIETAVTGIVEIYQTDFGFMAGALVATFVTIFCVLPVYYKFWDLGRKVSLSPLEIANAFNAPILKPRVNKPTHGDFDEVLHDVGKRRVQYGQLIEQRTGNFGIAEPQRVARPVSAHGTLARQSTKNKIGLGAVFGGLAATAFGGAHKD